VIFASVIADLSSSDRQEIQVRFTTIATGSPVGRRVEANIRLEAHLPRGAAEEIIANLLAEPNEASRLSAKYIEICERNVLGGPTIGGIRPKTLGRAVVLDSLCAHLVRNHGFRTSKQAEAWLKRQCKLDVAAVRASFAHVPLGAKVVWATFREPSRDEDPFVPLPPAPDSLHIALALDPKTRGQPLVLFVYSPPPGLALRFPTIADARWGRLFLPALNDSACEFGLTAPETDDPAVKPIPEVVHEQVFGDILAVALRLLR
jgi:hypothetical protein